MCKECRYRNRVKQEAVPQARQLGNHRRKYKLRSEGKMFFESGIIFLASGLHAGINGSPPGEVKF
jgi:hypothetical protein